MSQILLVDDDPQALDSTQRILTLAGHDVTTASNGQEALELCRKGDQQFPFDLILSDVRMPRMGGLEFLRALSLCGEETPVVLMTAYGRVEDAVWAMKLGAVDFLTKPFKRQTLLNAVEGSLKRGLRKKSAPLRAGNSGTPLVGTAARMDDLRSMLNQVAVTSATVLIQGESGTGKELVARCLHDQSPRKSRSFIALNCAAVPEQLIESELFGHEKGSFTGAASAKEGLFEAAHEGTLLLDEIGDMPLSVQAKLLRVLQEGEVRRVGATQSRRVNVRLLAATHRDLHASVREGKFREDLLYRLEVVQLVVPPLRERAEDIPVLARHFLSEACKRHHKEISGISSDAMDVLMLHEWPGNVRELSNVIERAVVFAQDDELRTSDLPPHLLEIVGRMERSGRSARFLKGEDISIPLGTPLKDVEELLIKKTLEATDGDKNMTANLLGINSRTIYRKLLK